MTTKINEISNFPAVFTKLKTLSLPFKTAYRLTLLSKEIDKHIEFYRETFSSLINEYGKRDEQGALMPTEDGRGVLIQDGKMDELTQKMNELDNLDVELPDTYFGLDDFGDIELTPEEMMVIVPFIKD